MISFNVSLTRAAQYFRFGAQLDDRITAVIGRSGSGKTTLMRLLAGLIATTSG